MYMGRKSLKKQKSIYQLSREQAGLTRRAAADRMGFVSEGRIEKIEGGKSQIDPAEVLAMEDAYKDSVLVNRHCTHQCPIGMKTVPVFRKRTPAEIVLEVLSLSDTLNGLRTGLIAGGYDPQWPAGREAVFSQAAEVLTALGRCGGEIRLLLREEEQEHEKN